MLPCPGCSSKFASLEKLDFHLNFACSSRPISSSSKRVKSCHKVTVTCPACSSQIVESELNFHLDTTCSSRTAPALKRKPADSPRGPPGLVVLAEFISEEEEQRLVALVDLDWSPSRRNGSQTLSRSWGVVTDYTGAKRRTRRPNGKDEEDMPAYFDFILERFRKYDLLTSWYPNECNANKYCKSNGDFLVPHFDDRILSGEIICNISLLSDAYMTFAKPNALVEPYQVHLPRRSASIMTRSSRWDYTHEIKNRHLLGETRISLNFRQCPL